MILPDSMVTLITGLILRWMAVTFVLVRLSSSVVHLLPRDVSVAFGLFLIGRFSKPIISSPILISPIGLNV